MMTIKQCLNTLKVLKDHSDTARLDVELLLSFVFKRDRSYLYTWPEKVLSKQQYLHFLQLLERRQAGEPMAYILGEKEFWSLPFRVNSSSLIPRPETELLVELSLDVLSGSRSKKNIIDLGTGAGAIALALASEQPKWRILAVDKHAEALELTRCNIERFGFTNVTLLQSDWLQLVPEQGYDLIVSNPPYIAKNDQHLNRGDLRYEPKTALISANNGLADLARIIRQAPDFLVAGGWLLLEHGYQQAEAVRLMLQAQGYVDCISRRDLSGQLRVTGGRVP